MRNWWEGLSLGNRLQFPVQLVLLAVMLLIHFAVLRQYRQVILDGAEMQAVVAADGVVNGLNMLMVNGLIRDPAQRRLYMDKMRASERLRDLRVLRSQSVQEQYGPGLGSERPSDAIDRRALETGQLQSELVAEEGRQALRVVVPFIATRNFRGTDCLSCHALADGGVAGAASLTLDLDAEFAQIARAGNVLWAVQLALQVLLYLLVGRIIGIILEQDLRLAELDHLASTDKLTGAWNRRRLEEAVRNEMDRLRRYDHPLSLLVLDIDHFKAINDNHGHPVGDRVLAELAAVIRATLRGADSLTRWGGEEFVVLCPNTTLSTEAMLAERLRDRIAKTVFPVVGKITVSIGVAACLAGETWEQWFQRADAALYDAKAGGRNQVQVAPEPLPQLGVGEAVAAHFLHLVWHPAYECGHPLLDAQHRALFAQANELLAASLAQRPADAMAALIDALVARVAEHFRAEEALLNNVGFPGAAAHAAEHGQLLAAAHAMVGRFNGGTLAVGELFQFLANDVIAKHILGADREFFPYLARNR